MPPIGHTNPLHEPDVHKVIAQFLPLFAIDQEATNLLRAHSQVGRTCRSIFTSIATAC